LGPSTSALRRLGRYGVADHWAHKPPSPAIPAIAATNWPAAAETDAPARPRHPGDDGATPRDDAHDGVLEWPGPPPRPPDGLSRRASAGLTVLGHHPLPKERQDEFGQVVGGAVVGIVGPGATASSPSGRSRVATWAQAMGTIGSRLPRVTSTGTVTRGSLRSIGSRRAWSSLRSLRSLTPQAPAGTSHRPAAVHQDPGKLGELASTTHSERPHLPSGPRRPTCQDWNTARTQPSRLFLNRSYPRGPSSSASDGRPGGPS
jgi:hypothetical protein